MPPTPPGARDAEAAPAGTVRTVATPFSHSLSRPGAPFQPVSRINAEVRAINGEAMAQMIAEEFCAQVPQVERELGRTVNTAEVGYFGMSRPLREAVETTPPAFFSCPWRTSDDYGWMPFRNSHAPFVFPHVMMSPYTTAVLLQMLDVKPDSRVLLVGDETGYFTRLVRKMLDFEDEGRLLTVQIGPRPDEHIYWALIKSADPSDYGSAGRGDGLNGARRGGLGRPERGKAAVGYAMNFAGAKVPAAEYSISHRLEGYDRVAFLGGLPYLTQDMLDYLDPKFGGRVVYPQYTFGGYQQMMDENLSRLMVFESRPAESRMEQGTVYQTQFYWPFGYL